MLRRVLIAGTFLLDVLPEDLQRIRYYGFLGNRYREQKLAHCRKLLGMPQPTTGQAIKDYRACYARTYWLFVVRVPSLSSRAHVAR
jgi:hypothetical protein